MAPQRVVRGAAEHRWLIAATLVVCAVVFLTSLLGTSDRERIDALTQETHAALCALKRNLAVRVAGTENYMRAVREGERVLPHGLTEDDIVAGLSSDKATLRSLSSLDCSTTGRED